MNVILHVAYNTDLEYSNVIDLISINNITVKVNQTSLPYFVAQSKANQAVINSIY